MALRLVLAACALFMATSVSAAEQRFSIGSFDELIVEGDIIVNLQTGKAPMAIAQGPQVKLGALRVERQGTVVRIRSVALQSNRGDTGPVIVALTGRDIKRVAVIGSGKITANALDNDTLRIEMRGAGVIEVGSLKASHLTTMLSGNGTLKITKGDVVHSDVVIEGSGTFVSAGLNVQNLKLLQRGPATTVLTVSNTAEISNNGTGAITIEGRGTCIVRRAGSATINCKKVQ